MEKITGHWCKSVNFSKLREAAWDRRVCYWTHLGLPVVYFHCSTPPTSCIKCFQFDPSFFDNRVLVNIAPGCWFLPIGRVVNNQARELDIDVQFSVNCQGAGRRDSV